MLAASRKLFPYFAVFLLIGSAVWALSFATLEPADFTFTNNTEVQSIDPARVTGVPEGRIVRAIFDGLYRNDHKTNVPVPGVAERHELSNNGLVYTFYLRKDAVWSDHTEQNPSPVTAHDFVWSWQRFLHPETASQYAYQLWYVKNAEKYSTNQVEVGDPVEVELLLPPEKGGRKEPKQVFPRGTIVKGKLKRVDRPPQPQLDGLSEDARDKEIAEWKYQWIYTVEADGKQRRFAKNPELEGAEAAHHVLLDFDQVGIRALDDYRLQVTLDNPTPFFLDLMCFYPMFPVNRTCVEEHGFPKWTKAENIVSNGPYLLKFRRIRDRIRLVKNPGYWDRNNVRLGVVDVLAVESATTGLNMYLNGEVDWLTTVPQSITDDLKVRSDYQAKEILATYFYRLNTTREPLNDKRVRQALNMALDKQQICGAVLRGGETPARSLVPSSMSEVVPYESPLCPDFDLERARELLAEAGYPGGQGIDKIEILYNTDEGHKLLAEVIQQQWKKNLGINITLKNMEWNVYLNAQQNLDYQIARAGWNADYPDPNTFLDMFVTGGANNETGWGNARYDQLINVIAKKEEDPAQRLAYLREAETILMDELPIMPIYYYVKVNMVRPDVQGWFSTPLDIHPLKAIFLDGTPVATR